VIESKYIVGVSVPSFDDAVSNVIQSYRIEGGGKSMKIAIENFDGTLYRVVTTVGLGAYIHATSSLQQLGLKDVLAESLNGKNGYDSWFVTTPLVLNPASLQSVLATDPASEIMGELDKLDQLPETERKSLLLSRVGQGEFRKQLVDYWKECAVTGATCVRLLKASHIKPWRDSNNQERLDVSNGLLLSPNIDAAFDAGHVTFDQNGKIMLSNAIAGAPAFQLHINAKLRINQKFLRQEHQAYLEYHRNEVFCG
jgi:hypothetical protein